MYIKMNSDKTLTITIPTTFYQGENKADMLTFLIPAEYENKNLADCKMKMHFVLPDEELHDESLAYLPEMYKDHLQYQNKVDTSLTAQEGDVVVWLEAQDEHDEFLWRTGEVVLTVYPTTGFDNDEPELPETDAELLKYLTQQVQELQSQKADNLTFHTEDNTIQLLADGVAIGDRIPVCAGHDGDADIVVINADVNDEGQLVIYFSDGTEKNIGYISAGEGLVYVPHIDEHKVLTFTIENMAGEIPDPVDLNPFDEWSDIVENDETSEYIWEEM